jgi:hypothetical protein
MYFHNVMIPNVAPKTTMFASPNWTSLSRPHLIETQMFPNGPVVAVWRKIFSVTICYFNSIWLNMIKWPYSLFPNCKIDMVMTRKIVCDIFMGIMNIINKHDFISGKSDLFQVVLTHFFKKYIDRRRVRFLFFRRTHAVCAAIILMMLSYYCTCCTQPIVHT